MSANEKPKLRPIEAFPFVQNGRRLVVLRDPLRWTENSIVVSPTLIPILQRFTGNNTVVDIQAEFARATGQILPSEALNGVIAKLDAQVEPAGKELTETLAHAKVAVESFNQAATSARQFIATHSGLGDELVGTLAQEVAEPMPDHAVEEFAGPSQG